MRQKGEQKQLISSTLFWASTSTRRTQQSRMSDSETSEEATCGHHETWEDFLESQATQVQLVQFDSQKISDAQHVIGSRSSMTEVTCATNRHFLCLSQIKNLEREVSVVQQRLEHALWHCFVYRHSLRKLSGGFEQHKKSLAEHQDKLNTDGPVCSECERDQMLKRIAYLEERLRSATMGSDGDDVSVKMCVL